ncbi:CrcB family protein [Neobacillus sp. OS1-33]|jgi:CrcB protein|uniref:fluoride efflux transporter FluC n=1 Tax=Neobacillus sp. OS1-33 TaxID=3070683 RepID=UPI0027E01221|nr:CrcB family protein [Neobacillus sp. OS1-33]WML25974.1 CrcB family protein [Neobacillus sp. OS1-33]
MKEILFISIGGFIGAIARFKINQSMYNNKGFPIGTLTVNLIGAFLLGLLFGLHVQGSLYSLLGIGFMGSFTTFSTLMLDAIKLNIENKKKLYYGYLLSSYTIGIILAFCGLWLGRKI